MTNKIKVDLTGVPKTLLLPLLGRAQFSKQPYSPIHDERAIQLVASLDYDFNDLLQQVGQSTLFWMARAYHFDQAIKHHIQQVPKSLIVNLGAGLETAFYRVDNGQLIWVDLDLPQVIALRQTLLPPPDRVLYLAKSILDTGWMDDVKAYGIPPFFFAGGLFMYFTEDQVKLIFETMAKRFPGSELIFDTISKKALVYANQMLHKSHMDAQLQWGLDSGHELERWSSRIKLVDAIPYFQGIKTKFPFPFLTRVKMFFYDFMKSHGIVHIKFTE